MKKLFVIGVIGLLLTACTKQDPTVVGDWTLTKYITTGGATQTDNTEYLFDEAGVIQQKSQDSSGNTVLTPQAQYVMENSIFKWKTLAGDDCLEFTVEEFTDHSLVLVKNDVTVCPSTRKKLFFSR